MAETVWWLVTAPLNEFPVEAGSEQEARRKALQHTKLTHKPYLADRWTFRVATEEDKREYAQSADAHRPAEPTLKTAKRKTKRPSDRLFGG